MSLKLINILLFEASNKRNYPVVSDTYPHITFSDNIVGSSTPSKDKINPVLLQDIEKAAAKANVMVDITTAVSGHRRGTRHETSQAVDIARFYNDKGKPVGYSGESIAKARGIYDKINSFVAALETLGYKKNVGESGNPKVVLTFGFKNHHHHVHVSNTMDAPSIDTGDPIQTEPDDILAAIKPITSQSSDEEMENFIKYLISGKEMTNQQKNKALLPVLSAMGLDKVADIIGASGLTQKESVEDFMKLTEDIKRIKKLI